MSSSWETHWAMPAGSREMAPFTSCAAHKLPCWLTTGPVCQPRSISSPGSAESSSKSTCSCDWRHVTEIMEAGRLTYGETLNIVVWVKSNAGQGSFYRSQHEFVVVFRAGEAAHLNNVELGRHGCSHSNVWNYRGVNTFGAGRMEELRSHPTVKPVALVADAMRDCTRRRDIVLDTFSGSGTTIMAAERIGRRAYTKTMARTTSSACATMPSLLGRLRRRSIKSDRADPRKSASSSRDRAVTPRAPSAKHRRSSPTSKRYSRAPSTKRQR